MCSKLLFQTTSQITFLARSGCIGQARKLFDEMPQRDTIAWNAMLSGYNQLGFHNEALSLFHHMRKTGVGPDHFSFTATLSSCAGACDLGNGIKIHTLMVVFGYQSSLPVNNALIDMYGKCLNPSSAVKAFEEINYPNGVSWCSLLFAHANSGQFNVAREVFDVMPKTVNIPGNMLIVGYAQCGEIEMCLDLFREMLENSCQPDQWTFSALVSACTESSEFSYGCMIHAFVIKSGWSSAVEARNSIFSFYAKLGCKADAMKLLEPMEILNLVSWNAIIDAYMKEGDTHKALTAFQRAPEKNLVSWTSMITGYATNGRGDEALSFFADMLRNYLRPDDFTFGAALHACSNLAVLGHGRMVHGSIIQYGFNGYAYVANGLVNMYAKCGDVDGSSRAFNEIYHKDLISWNAMLFAFGLHGKANQALQLYEDMVSYGVIPDKVTFLGLLMTCSHSGLIEKGRLYFESMLSLYGLPHGTDHVACMVDMLGRGGYLAEAKDLAIKYSKTVDSKTVSFEALLRACTTYRDVGMGECVGRALKSLEPQQEISYVLQSNLYCANGQWQEAEMVRKLMADQGLKKIPGCSWIEIRNEVIAFVAGSLSHPYMEELHRIIQFLEFEMRNPCFISFES
ncbi:pentatricopeptide repeat-containing protein [Tripterygium wilfordii]|uniref:Pentatricopeptide repeat-containing protein n=1 Tax=Tripterygium wilfordii TaxID=458696 RepID=A0A7J7CSH6_TRIWF|nr:pentatricopeptide repeat-containing protein At2g36980, mitochondrial [Tripterygium wilfordii]XP_038722614.1 pentatricopeptide repeat-containing protein At2g36980, mitochondrial [Tripterygium wilfordii]KAF5736919.1 pentatricopeptide repeat-containing protein [Tripterygium wilfordii]